MTNIQAALLFDQLNAVAQIRADKHVVFETYKRLLGGHVTLPKAEEGTMESEWMFVCGVNAEYKDLEAYMKENGVDIRPFFYDIKRHAHLSHIEGPAMDLDRCFCMLPSYPDLTVEQIEKICGHLLRCCQRL
jgi:dTDP-4-amino-4,6-dideoxygalactose transaminase